MLSSQAAVRSRAHGDGAWTHTEGPVCSKSSQQEDGGAATRLSALGHKPLLSRATEHRAPSPSSGSSLELGGSRV